MGFFGLRKKDNFVDLTEKYKKQQEKIKSIQEESTGNNSSQESPAPGIFGMFGSGNSEGTSIMSNSEGSDAVERRKKLAKRLMDMTDKIEDLSNQIFHLQQRIEILEKRDNY